MIKSRKRLEAQARAKKEQEERQKKRDEELRLENERRTKEMQERERQERRAREERQVYEAHLSRTQMTVTLNTLAKCRQFLSQVTLEKWTSKQFQWCMRCDGLPDPSSLPQLNSYRNRWLDLSREERPSMNRLVARAPELGRVIRDLDDLLEDTRDIGSKLVAQLYDMRQDLALLLRSEIDAGIGSVLNDVTDHLVPEEAFLHLQITMSQFSLALGSDTSKNSTQTKYDFSQLGVKVDIPRQIFTLTDRPLVVSFVQLLEGHHLEPPIINGAQQLPSLLDPVKKEDYSNGFGASETDPKSAPVIKMKDIEESRSKRPDQSTESPRPQIEILDLDANLLVRGVYQVQVIRLPLQPRRFNDCTVALLEENHRKVQEFQVSFAPADGAGFNASSKHDDDGEGKEADEEMEKLIAVTIKLPNWVFWMSPTPVRYVTENGVKKWTSRGIWEVKFHEEIGGPSLRFCLEEPSLVSLSQAKKANLPLQGWTLFPTHVRRSIFSFSKDKMPAENAAAPEEEEDDDDDDDLPTEGGPPPPPKAPKAAPVAPAATGGAGGGEGGWENGGIDSSDEEEEPGAGVELNETAEEVEEDFYDSSIPSVLLTISGAVVTLDIEIQENQVFLRKVRSSTVVNIQDLAGQSMTPYELVKILRQRGLELSPSRQVSGEIEDITAKNELLEQHVYRCMALGATSQHFSFLWSRWNNAIGKDHFIFQLQHFDGENLSPAQLIQVEPKRTRILPFTEATQSLEESETSVTDSKFYVDLFATLCGECPPSVKSKLEDPSPIFANTIYQMLAATRPLSLA